MGPRRPHKPTARGRFAPIPTPAAQGKGRASNRRGAPGMCQHRKPHGRSGLPLVQAGAGAGRAAPSSSSAKRCSAISHSGSILPSCATHNTSGCISYHQCGDLETQSCSLCCDCCHLREAVHSRPDFKDGFASCVDISRSLSHFPPPTFRRLESSQSDTPAAPHRSYAR